MTWAYIVIGVMIALSAFFSASEIAFNSANKMRLRRAAEGGSKVSKIAYDITEKFTVALSAILIGNNLANIGASSLASVMVILLLGSDDYAWVSTAVLTVLCRR